MSSLDSLSIESTLDNSEQIDIYVSPDKEPEAKTSDNITDITIESIDLSDIFMGINGCAIIYSPDDDKYSAYNSELCKQQTSPYSTFKIISTLAGLHNGIIENETSTMNYTGVQYPVSEWNEDLALEKAFKSSCIWFFRQIIDTVGYDEIQDELISLDYGNCDISEWNGNNINPLPELNGFWMGSSLKISPLEQVQVLTKIFEGESIYRDKEINILRQLMLVDEDTIKIYGKTGSSSNGEAWFVGFSEDNYERKYFAIYLNDSTQNDRISGSTAKEISLSIIQNER
ncbi:MAG: class D beta-lactamase [Lachnospiraceae bacterium]|nr:class D beta-lactamase [Lachnospiraceae bacterium]